MSLHCTRTSLCTVDTAQLSFSSICVLAVEKNDKQIYKHKKTSIRLRQRTSRTAAVINRSTTGYLSHKPAKLTLYSSKKFVLLGKRENYKKSTFLNITPSFVPTCC